MSGWRDPTFLFDDRADISQYMRHRLTSRIPSDERRIVQFDPGKIEVVRLERQCNIPRNVTLEHHRQIRDSSVFNEVIEPIDHHHTWNLFSGRSEDRRLIISEVIDLDKIVVFRPHRDDPNELLDPLFFLDSEQGSNPSVHRVLCPCRHSIGIDHKHLRQSESRDHRGTNSLPFDGIARRQIGRNGTHLPNPPILCKRSPLAIEDQPSGRLFDLPAGCCVCGLLFVVVSPDNLHITETRCQSSKSGEDRSLEDKHSPSEKHLVGPAPLPVLRSLLRFSRWIVGNSFSTLKHVAMRPVCAQGQQSDRPGAR